GSCHREDSLIRKFLRISEWHRNVEHPSPYSGTVIASVRGPLLRQGAGFLILEIGGMGGRVEVPSGARAPKLSDEEVFLHTSLIVREDALTLYGFETVEEITVFEHMITVSGVGPKSALGVLSALTPYEIARAVIDENDKAFRQAPGIGPKTAKLLIVS